MICFQLNVFRTDFEAEKQCKQKVEIENDKLSEEVQNMRVCCQELHEEIIALRRTANRTVSVSTSSSSPFEVS